TGVTRDAIVSATLKPPMRAGHRPCMLHLTVGHGNPWRSLRRLRQFTRALGTAKNQPANLQPSDTFLRGRPGHSRPTWPRIGLKRQVNLASTMNVRLTLFSEHDGLLQLVGDFAKGLGCLVYDVPSAQGRGLQTALPSGDDSLLELLSYVALSATKSGVDV